MPAAVAATSTIPRQRPARASSTARRRRPAARAQRAAAPRPRRLHRRTRSSLRQLERRRDGDRRGRDRLGPGRGARVRVAARRGHPDPAHRPGHRARHLLAPPRRPARRRAPARRYTPIQHLDERGARRSRSTTRRSPSTRASASSTATRPPRRRRSCSGRRSSATSSTARRSIIDQFISAGLSKWRQTSRLTLLLPHGYEGNGPEHSSARLERFLQLAAQENIRIANCTTAAQYFHLLRRQALDAIARPLVVMTPKGLLRLKQAGSTLDDLAERRVPAAARRRRRRTSERVERLVLCQGKIYYDIVGHEQRADADAASRSPGSSSSTRSRSSDARGCSLGYPNLREVVWAQEEPQNMGAWRAIRHRLEEARPRACRSATSAARGARARARATRPRTCASRTGSCAPRSASSRFSGGAGVRAPLRPSRRASARACGRASSPAGAAAGAGGARRPTRARARAHGRGAELAEGGPCPDPRRSRASYAPSRCG